MTLCLDQGARAVAVGGAACVLHHFPPRQAGPFGLVGRPLPAVRGRSPQSTVREVAVSERAVLVLIVFAVSLSVAADPPQSASTDEIAKAIRQLGDSRYTVREQATKRL